MENCSGAMSEGAWGRMMAERKACGRLKGGARTWKAARERRGSRVGLLVGRNVGDADG